MKTKLKSLIAFAAFTVALAACSSTSNSSAPQNDQIKTDTTKKEVQANYVCPMGKECGFSDKPGKCPSCGKDMVAAK